MKRPVHHKKSSGNVFADIGLPNAGEHLIKAKLVLKIDGLMRARGLKQIEAAKLFGVKQPDVSKMLRGDFRQFSVERLLRFLVALGQDVEIVVKPHKGRGVADLPLKCHPVAFRVSVDCMPLWAGGATGRNAEPSVSAAWRPVAASLAAKAAGV